MKTGVATVLSLAGVLVAGSAAALVNARVLQTSDPVAGGAAESITTGSVATGSIVSPVVSPGSMPEASATQALYRVGDAGTVLLDTGGEVLTVVAVTPATQWTVVSVESSGDQVAVVLRGPTRVATFTASLISGVVATDLDIDEIPPGTAPGGTRPSTTIDDDDHDDDETDEHHDDHDDDEPDEPDDDDD